MHKILVPLFALVHPHPDLSMSALATRAACATLVHGSRQGITLTDLGEM